MAIEKVVIVGTFLTCALALMFPPWGWNGASQNFQTFAFLLSKVPVAWSEDFNASIIWPTLGLEVGAILSIGLALYFSVRK
ncbi:MAG: hypothetical protein Q7J42_05260 [Sulfuritalea sp.]|nr:hypothetical protein [Sulfuritalea sp.]